MSYKVKKNQKKYIFKCSKCGHEISEEEEEWIATYNRCPRCNQNTMKAKEEGKISNYVDYGENNSISIANKKYSSTFFDSNIKELKYNKITNSLNITLNTDKILDDIKERINKECDKLNTKPPNYLKIKNQIY